LHSQISPVIITSQVNDIALTNFNQRLSYDNQVMQEQLNSQEM